MEPLKAMWTVAGPIISPIAVLLLFWLWREARHVLSSRQRLDKLEAELPKLATGEVVDEQLAAQVQRIERLEQERIANAREIGELQGRHANLDLVIELAYRAGVLSRGERAGEESQ